MTQPIKRAYAGKDVEMLTVCGIIINHAIDNSTVLIAKRANWADPFLPDLKSSIENAFTNILGIDNAQALRQATMVVRSIQDKALNDLAEFKVQIQEDFKSDKLRRDEILNTLGFTAHHKDARKKDQEALVELLIKFKVNMTAVLNAEIIAAGMFPGTIATIIGYADNLRDSNINQETLKGSRKTLSANAVNQLNSIYNASMSVARISANFFKTDSAMKDKFSYAKNRAVLNGGSSPTPPPTPPAP